MGKKKFIDKKKSATFQLISRDTSDPNYNEGPSGDRVFVRVDENPYSIDSFDKFNENVNDSDSIFADAPDDYDDEEEGDGEGGGRVLRRRRGMELMPNGVPALPNHVRKEILELGFPDDGYNYLAHLREIKNSGGGSAYYQNPKAKLDQLPNDVKAYDASRIEISKANDDLYEKSIYNVASKTVGVRIQKVFDPEVAALLDESDSCFGSDVEDLDEDFVVNANLANEPADAEFDKKLSLIEEPEVKGVEQFVSKSSYSQENVAHLFSGEPKNLAQDISSDMIDGKPRVRRLLDEQFDLLEHREYGTDSEDEYDNFIDEEDEYHIPLAEKLNHALKEHIMDDLALEEAYNAPSDLLHYVKGVEDTEPVECAADVIQKCMEYAEKYENENTDDEVVVVEESSDESEVWDCETIVSTYSNLDNHPGKIGAPEARRKKKLAETLAGALSAPSNVISLKGKQNLPVDFLPHSRKNATENLKKESNLKTEALKRKQIGQESKEEKKERKAAIKEERREARQAKKEMKGLYKCEAKHAQKVAAFTGPSSIHLM